MAVMAEGQGTPNSEQERIIRKPWTLREYSEMPLWDWMNLLIVPFMLAAVTLPYRLTPCRNRRVRILSADIRSSTIHCQVL